MAQDKATKSTVDHLSNGHTEGSQPSNARDRETEVRERAYAIWENEGKPDGQQIEHWERAEKQINGEFAPGDAMIEGGDIPKLSAQREAIREHRDTFLIESDLEDADQREAAPGVREQP